MYYVFGLEHIEFSWWCEKLCPSLPAGVGGIETEAVMLGMPLMLTLPEVVGCELTGTVSPFATSIDIVLSITKVRVQCLFKHKRDCCKYYQWCVRN